MRTFKSRPADIGHERCLRIAVSFGRELRLARTNSGLTQKRLGILAGVSQQVVSMAERGDPDVSIEIRCALAAACGHELGWRLHPVATVSLRDSGQLSIVQAIAAGAHRRWTAHVERPVAPGDNRAADLLLGLPEELDHVEVERALLDGQAQIRSAQVKREIIAAGDPRPTRLIIAVPDSSLTRERLAPLAPLIARSFPIPSREIWHAIRNGHPVGGDGILFVQARSCCTTALICLCRRHGTASDSTCAALTVAPSSVTVASSDAPAEGARLLPVAVPERTEPRMYRRWQWAGIRRAIGAGIRSGAARIGR